MKQRTVGIVALLLFVLAPGARLAAQSYRSFLEEYDAIREQSKFHVGSLRFVPVFRLYDVGYDSNVYFSDEESGVVSDATATLSPELRAYWLTGGSLILSVTENPEFIAYARELALRSFTNSISASLRWLALRRFSLAAEYHTRSHVRRSLNELEHRIRDTATGATASLFFETPRGTSLGVVGAVDDFRYEDVALGAPDDIYGRMLDRREASAALEFYYRVFSRSYVFATVTGVRYDFLYPESAWRNGSSLEASGGFRFPLVGRARGAVRIGWKSFRPDSPDETPFSGLVAATEASFRMGRLALTLGFDRDNAFSYNETAYYYVDARVRAGLSLYLFRSLRLDGGVQYGTISYPEPQEVWDDGVLVVVADREDIQQNFSLGPVVRLAGTIGLGVTLNSYKRTSNAPGFDVRRNFIGAFITYEF